MKQPTEYQLWKEGHKLTLRAYTEEEIFYFGYEAGRTAVVEPEPEVIVEEVVQPVEETPVEEPKIPKNSKKK